MSLIRGKIFCSCRILTKQFLKNSRNLENQVTCGFHQKASKTALDFYRRREEQGPERERPRSVWSNWNLDAEIYSFGKRLGEEFHEHTIKQAFTSSSYVESEQEKRRKLLVDDEQLTLLDMPDNNELANTGEQICTEYIKGYLRHHFPLYPEEGICSICNYLMSEEILLDVAKKIGMNDLILCKEFPVAADTVIHTFMAVIGAIAKDSNKARAELFIQDFVLTQLIGKEVSELWNMHNPMGILTGVLDKQGRPAPEPRLIWESGSETVLAVYMVGLYCDKQLIGKAAGETVSIAEDMAARTTLRQIFGLTQDRKPFAFGKEGHSLTIDTQKLNPSVLEYCSQGQITHLQ